MTAKISPLIAYAKAEAEKNGHRWTEMREYVYSMLLTSKCHLTAYELMEKLSAKHDKDIKAASVYRSLEALVTLGVVVKIESLNAFYACHHPQEQHQHVFLVCDSCGNTDEIADHNIGQKLRQNAATHGFRTQRQVLELHGDCRDCQT